MSGSGEGMYYTVPEAARLLRVSPATVWRWIQAEKLPAYRVGHRNIRIRKEDLDTVITPARRKDGSAQRERTILERPTADELARRQALVARILVERQRRAIAPLITAELVRQVREEQEESYG